MVEVGNLDADLGFYFILFFIMVRWVNFLEIRIVPMTTHQKLTINVDYLSS